MKNMVLLCNSGIIPSGRILRNVLQDLTNKRIIINPRITNNKIILRYGESVQVDGIESNFNSRESIIICSNKLNFSKLMKDNNIFSPIYYRNEPETFPVLIRETLTGHGGVGIHIVESIEQFNELWSPRFYWTPYVELKSEYRVHIFNGEILRIFKKELVENNLQFFIRNNNNCHFALKNTESFPKLKQSIEEFSKIDLFSTGFYGLDVGWTGEKFFFIEANSAPGLNENSGRILGEKIYESMDSTGLFE